MGNLILAIASSASIALLMRTGNSRIQSKSGMFAVNYLICLMLAAGYTLPGRTVSADAPGGGIALGLGVVSGALYLINFLLMQWCMVRRGVVISSIFAKLGVVVSTLLSILLFRELPGGLQWAGCGLAVAAILLMNWQSGGVAEKLDLWPVLLMLCSGVTDAMSKIYAQVGEPTRESEYLMYTFAAALAFCMLLVLVQKQPIRKAELLFGALIGVPNYYSARFLLKALTALPAVVVYPTYSVGTILTVTLAGVLVFGEKLTHRQLVGGGMILAALVLLNL